MKVYYDIAFLAGNEATMYLMHIEESGPQHVAEQMIHYYSELLEEVPNMKGATHPKWGIHDKVHRVEGEPYVLSYNPTIGYVCWIYIADEKPFLKCTECGEVFDDANAASEHESQCVHEYYHAGELNCEYELVPESQAI